MKLTLLKSVFLEGLNAIQNVVSSRPVNPILVNALITVDPATGVTLTATDTEITVKCTISGDIKEAGAITLPVKRLTGIVREFTDEKISVAIDDRNIAGIRCGSSNVKLHGMSASEFPAVPSTEGSVSYIVAKEKFAEMLQKTHYAASSDDSRQALTGVLLNFKDGKLTCVATDGRRLAMMEHEVEFPKENNRDIILPKRAVAELLRILSGEGDLKIHISKGNQAIFSFDNIVMCCKLVDSVYPNFRQVIITKCDHRITVPREELLMVLRRAVLVTTEKSNSMRLTFADNMLSLTASSPDVGEVQESITVKYSGPVITAIFNPVFMADPLRALTNDEIYIELNDAMSPGLIKADLPFLYVLMPLRV